MNKATGNRVQCHEGPHADVYRSSDAYVESVLQVIPGNMPLGTVVAMAQQGAGVAEAAYVFPVESVHAPPA